MRVMTALALSLLTLSARADADSAKSPPVSVSVAKATAAPTVDGVLAEGEWANAARIKLTHQIQPGDNAPPSERTEVFLTYTKEHLYVAFHAYDSDPATIRARVTRRDDIFNDDYVTLHLDTYDDRRRAYVFSFNPLGIQADGIYTEGVSVGRNWDSNVDRT